MSSPNLNFAKCRYLISTYGGVLEVEGYAIQCAESIERFAVRDARVDGWVADHWDTGFRICSGCASMADAVKTALARLEQETKKESWPAKLRDARAASRIGAES